MARKKGGPNKSQAVRDLLTQRPDMAVKDIVATLSDKGMTIKPNLVYFLKGKMKAGKQRRTKVIRAARAAASTNSDPVTLIREIKALAEKSGGISKLRELVEALAE
jgi:hypothetical protein